MFYLINAAVPHMKPGSCIINTASINSDMPNPTLLAYAKTKGDPQFHRRVGAAVGRKRNSRQRGCARTNLDPADSIDHAGRSD
jgi:hypothetical protein